MNRIAAALVSACCLTWALTAGAQVHRSDDIVGRAALESAGYGKLWSADLLLDGGDRVRDVRLVDENLYVRTRSGVVYAVQADTGLLRWSQPLNDHAFRQRPPTHVRTDGDDGPVVFVTYAQVHVFDRYSGELVRRITLPFPAGGGAIADASTMYLGGADGLFYALRWRCCVGGEPLTRWRVAVDGVVTSLPVLALDDRLYFASAAGTVYCVDPSNKVLYWSFRIPGRIAGGLHVDESGVYVGASNDRLYVLNPRTGEPLQTYILPSEPRDTPMVVQRTVYQYCEQEGLFAFDVDTRKPLWHKPAVRRFVARAAEKLVLLTGDGDLLAADNDSGAERHVMHLPDDTLVATNTRDAILYIIGSEGRLLCAGPLGYPPLRRERVARARLELARQPAPTTGAKPGVAPARSARNKGLAGEWLDDPLRSDLPR